MKAIKLALHWQMGIALILGATLGIIFCDSYSAWGNVINGIGDIFLHAINMIVIPLVFLSTVLGISTMTDSKSMGRIAVKTFLYFIVTAVLAAAVGVIVADVLRPGYGTHKAEVDAGGILETAQATESSTLMDIIVDIVPSNIFEAFSSGNILPIIFFSLLLGYFITKIRGNRQATINNVFESFSDAIMALTNFIIRLAPLGIFAIVMVLVGKQASDLGALKECFRNFAFFVIVVWISLIVMGGIVLPIMVGLMAKVSPIKHLKQIYSALMVAFSTSSSYSALPLIISDAKEKMGVSNNIASFTVPLGITFNKIGTIVYECVAVIFVAQAVGMDLTAAQQVSLIGASIVTVLGAPSVPMAGVITLAVLLAALGLPTDYIGMFMAIDILCDMPKTLLNAYSVSCSAIIVARSEGEILKI
ncbi:MAG: dicarboxylate/amino acid:cation symporter [Bacteroidales bacterium]|nr:dicarboxylate/amino acid:cation symporter [Bacteroidales bacterium]MDY5443173.1 dicarboxylate/amino acid:cation symporter [Candidatus Cryptobacteroides sp.]